MKNTQSLLSITRLKKYYPVSSALFRKNRTVLRAVDNLSLEIKRGETFALVGESGCGKSTFGRTVLGLTTPTDGVVIYRGITLEEALPSYLFATLKNAEMLRIAYLEDTKNAFLSARLYSAVKILGGFLGASGVVFTQGIAALKEKYTALKKGDKQAAALAENALNALRTEAGKDKAFAALEEKLDSGVDLCRLTEKEWRKFRSDLQIVFQDPYSSLNPRMTVGQIIAEGAYTHNYFKRGEKELDSYVLQLMQSCGLQPFTAQRYPHEFSGGQRQRVCIARALSVRPKFIVCDECVSALDVSVQAQILNLLSTLKEEKGLTYLFISHDISVVRHVSDRVAVMYLGQIMEQGETERVFDSPLHPYTIALLSAVPTTKKKRTQKIEWRGDLPSPNEKITGCPFHTRCFMAQEICKREYAPLKEVEKGRFVACHFAEKSTKEKRAIATKDGQTK